MQWALLAGGCQHSFSSLIEYMRGDDKIRGW